MLTQLISLICILGVHCTASPPRRYTQDAMDEMVGIITKVLVRHKKDLWNLSPHFDSVFTYYSPQLSKIDLMISTHLPTVQKKEGCLQTTDQKMCQEAQSKKVPCREVTLRTDTEQDFGFEFPNEDEYNRETRLQLRFFYKDNPKCWLGSKSNLVLDSATQGDMPDEDETPPSSVPPTTDSTAGPSKRSQFYSPVLGQNMAGDSVISRK
ncbi:hypothetical protein Ciccas_012460 [Cichlidogyrus casuarinus]|uniref:Uncharacterized protein n=1 Tax=Cichlidogyrus casuarinus TaxID=1844966 RepID=A0ABD2PNB8_9PLAT